MGYGTNSQIHSWVAHGPKQDLVPFEYDYDICNTSQKINKKRVRIEEAVTYRSSFYWSVKCVEYLNPYQIL